MALSIRKAIVHKIKRKDNMEYTYNNYKLTTNDGGFIVGFMAVLGDEYDWYGQPAEVEHNHNGISMAYGCYKLEEGDIVFYQNEYNRLKAIEEREREEREREEEKPKAQLLYTALMTDTLLPEDEEEI